ncbi:MAG: DUF4332 domain-containing protein [Candidatus Promineifilaceae bacterium]|jgi:uncharacterized membrane protein/predicted flap endonuclease-1-like 5' DNA nuclease
MSNKNRNLIVAYFDTADEADAVAVKLKLWDKARKDIKLGGMGIISMDDDKLKIDKVGARAAGTGAKWGTILGAAGGLAAGLLTGGIGLIPGAIAGLGLGTGTGALFHKRVGLTDEDKARLEDHFKKGGAALAVMADDFEVEPTKTEIAELGGHVENFTVPEEVMNEVAERHEAIDEAQKEVEMHFSEENDGAKWDKTEMFIAVPGMTAATVADLDKADVKDVEDLQEKAATAEGRAELAEATGMSRDDVEDIAYKLDLGRVRGIGRKSLLLLNAAGIESVGDLAQYDADELAGLLTTVNEEDHIVDHMPSVDTLSFWLEQANELPPYLVAIQVKKDMLNVDEYEWHAKKGDDPRKTRADALLFNRKEGYEVILMIQKICNTFGYMTVDDVKNVESIIANELPGSVRGQKKVYNWLVDYIDTH